MNAENPIRAIALRLACEISFEVLVVVVVLLVVAVEDVARVERMGWTMMSISSPCWCSGKPLVDSTMSWKGEEGTTCARGGEK